MSGVTEPSGVHLVRSAELTAEVDALAERLGGRVGVEAVLADLNRTAEPARVPAGAALAGFRWDREDRWSRRWYPQGITSTADRDPCEEVAGRRLLCTSWYARDRGDAHRGSRLSFVDVTDPVPPRYRHVLLVEPVRDQASGQVDVRPMRVHAGGLLWHGPYLYVAATGRGLCVFRVDDMIRVPGGSHELFGYRYVLPLRFRYDGVAEEGTEPLRYSFLSLDRGTTRHELVAGEYGRRGMTTRLVRFDLDDTTSLLRTDHDGPARPLGLELGDLESMQGIVVVGGRYYVSASAGRLRRGSLYVGRPGAFREHAGVLPVGPEDLTSWPSTDRLWSLTEYPGRRYVFAMDRTSFD